MFFHFFLESLLHNLQSILGWFDLHSGLVQAIATIVLVLITFRSIKEAQNTRQDTRLPIIKIEIEGPINYGMKNQNITFFAENIGYGLALDVELSFMLNNIERIKFGNIEVGSTNHINLEISKEKLELMEKATKMTDVLILSYRDIFDRNLTTFANIVNENENRVENQPWLKVANWRVNLPS